ncbi:hypothetical protein [Flavobacterium magnesitis]|uniref:hypothetical protein n=1 Tax=Flavobacterium magnesitis TaxID=3138077 RepID=UPI00358E93F7
MKKIIKIAGLFAILLAGFINVNKNSVTLNNDSFTLNSLINSAHADYEQNACVGSYTYHPESASSDYYEVNHSCYDRDHRICGISSECKTTLEGQGSRACQSVKCK